jgi:hypothetical protein
MDGALSQTQQGEAINDPQAVLQRIRKGEGLRSIGESLGMSHEGVRKWLFREVGVEYHEIQTEGLIERVVYADKRLEEADDPVDIARAREMAKFARMDLERRRPGLYGQKTHVTVENVTDLGDALRRSRSREIDVTPGVQCTNQPDNET